MPRSNKRKLTERGPIHERHLQSGIQFLVKYSGSQLIEDIRRGQQFSASVVSVAIQSLLDFNRKVRHKSTPAVLTLSTQGIEVHGGAPSAGEAPALVSASIDRIAYCTADKRNCRVFGFVARNRVNETVELHVCKCANDREPVQLAYSLNEAFEVAARNLADQQAVAAAASVDEQPLVWSDSQALSMSRLAPSSALPAAASASAAEIPPGHNDWVQF